MKRENKCRKHDPLFWCATRLYGQSHKKGVNNPKEKVINPGLQDNLIKLNGY